MTRPDARIFWTGARLLALWLVAAVGIAGCRGVVDAPIDLAEIAANTAPLTRQDNPRRKSKPSQIEASEQEIKSAEKVLSSSVEQIDDKALRPKRVESRGWYLNTGNPLYLAQQLNEDRWRHQALEGMLDSSLSSKTVLWAGTKSDDPEIRATAFIGLVRNGESALDDDLAELIRDSKIALTTKGALLEALSNHRIIDELFAERHDHVEENPKQDKAANSQLRQQFWITLASSVPSVREDPRFSSTFLDEPADVQATILDLMLADSSAKVPETVHKRFEFLSPEVMHRIHLWQPYLRTLAPIEILATYTRSPNFSIRESAIIGLGREGSPAAHALLLEIDQNDPSLVQAAAVMAWGLMPQHEQWTRLGESNSWRVREAVAHWIPLTPRNRKVIEKLEGDKSHQVRQAMLARTSIATGSPIKERAAPAMDKPKQEAITLPPDEAVEILEKIELAQREEDPIARTQARQTLLLFPQKVLAAVDQAAQQIANYDNAYLFDVLLPQCDPAYQRLQEATTGSSRLTLIALRELERRSQHDQLPELILWRLSQNTERFSNVDWQAIMAIVRDDGRAPASRLARRALGHEDPVVRVSACEHVTRFPIPDVTLPLEDSLQHESPAVRKAAIQALSQVDGAQHRKQFVNLLMDRETEVQLAAALALDALQDDRGIHHIRRMTYSSSRETRLKATQAIASRDQESDIPELIRLLDDETSIRLAAIEGLVKHVPAERHPPAHDAKVSLDAKCAAWKNWFDRQSPMR